MVKGQICVGRTMTFDIRKITGPRRAGTRAVKLSVY